MRSSLIDYAATVMPHSQPMLLFIYLLIESEDGFHTSFVVAKTRVAPLRKQSIPRLELLSAVLLARLTDAMKSSLATELEISSCHCFTDSRVALCWIRNMERS